MRDAPVIAFAASVTSEEQYRAWAAPGIESVAEPDSEILSISACGSIFESYNRILDSARGYGDLEALVLVHQDTEIFDPDFCVKLRRALEDPSVGVVGCAGAIDVTSIAWWEGTVTWASYLGMYEEFGGGEVPSLCWGDEEEWPEGMRTGEVETVDGFCLVLSPWVVGNIRFDEGLAAASGLHGYDLDFCLQVREAGYKVMTENLRAIHHRREIYLVDDPEAWIAAHMLVAEKWGQPHRRHERRREAEAAAARLAQMEAELRRDAMARSE